MFDSLTEYWIYYRIKKEDVLNQNFKQFHGIYFLKGKPVQIQSYGWSYRTRLYLLTRDRAVRSIKRLGCILPKFSLGMSNIRAGFRNSFSKFKDP